jgi:hypothetical protein
MTKLFWPALIGAAISATSVLATSRLAMSSTMPDLRDGVAVFYIAGMAVLFWRLSRAGGLAALIWLAIAMTVVAIVAVQAENLLWSGGRFIGKDFDPFSWDHLMHTVLSLEVVGGCYGVLVAAVYLARRFVRWRRPQQV